MARAPELDGKNGYEAREHVRERRRVKDILGRVPEVLKGERVLENEGASAVGRKWGK